MVTCTWDTLFAFVVSVLFWSLNVLKFGNVLWDAFTFTETHDHALVSGLNGSQLLNIGSNRIRQISATLNNNLSHHSPWIWYLNTICSSCHAASVIPWEKDTVLYQAKLDVWETIGVPNNHASLDDIILSKTTSGSDRSTNHILSILEGHHKLLCFIWIV